MTVRVTMQTSLDRQTKTKRFEEKISNLSYINIHFRNTSMFNWSVY